MQAYSFVPSKKAAQVTPPVKTSDPASTSAIVQTTPTPHARKVVEGPLSVAKAVEKAGIRASEEDIQKIKELIARLKTATGEDRVRALKDVKSIACIT
jgi:hypothetical protein